VTIETGDLDNDIVVAYKEWCASHPSEVATRAEVLEYERWMVDWAYGWHKRWSNVSVSREELAKEARANMPARFRRLVEAS
jgi:hypothetical protein